MKAHLRPDRKKLLFFLFVFLVIIQVSVPSGMIISRELTIKAGKQYKFRVIPVDPYDAFRGRYVFLSVVGNVVPLDKEEEYMRRQTVFALIEEDVQGYARIMRIQRKRPGNGSYIKARIGYINTDKNTVSVALPFNRYYMDEFEAPKAEKAYMESSGKKGLETYITVRIRSGNGVIEGLYIDEKHIREYIKMQNDE